MKRWMRAFAMAGLAAATARAGLEAPAVVTARCALCHGARGESAAEDFPRLAAQNEAYLAKQLHDFRSGARQGIMARMVKGVPEEEFAAIARYFASQPSAIPAAASEMAAVGRYVFLHGDKWAGIPACRTCHGETAHGTPTLPRLAGQHADYLERQLREFTQRKRTNDNEVMHSIAERLTALETRALAEYLSSLP